MKVLCVLGKHQYGQPALGVGTEYAAFTAALRQLDHEVVHFESWNRSLYRTYEESNRLLLEMVEKEKPAVLFSVQRDYETWTETLEMIRERGVSTISWATDDSWKFKRTSRFIGHHYDAMTTTCESAVAGYERERIPVLLTQWAANSSWLQEPLRASECTYGVSFIGAAYGQRRAQVERLRKRGIQVDCFGQGWPGGPVAVEEIPRIVRRSVVSLNFPESFGPGQNQIKARTFEVPGAGGMLLTGDSPGLSRYYVPGKEIMVYRDDNDLAEKIAWIRNHPAERDAIAIAGYRRTHRDHTYERRLKEVMAFAIQSRRPGVSVPAGSFEPVALRHRILPWQAALRDLLVRGAGLIWGEQRGRRAARRIVMEASLRLQRKHTYSAAGLPGRLFPEQ